MCASTARCENGSRSRCSASLEMLEKRQLLASTAEVTWTTYLGGTQWDQGLAVAHDRDGNTFVAGRTESADFEGAVNPSPIPGRRDIDTSFVAKLSSSGGILWARYLEGWAGIVSALACDSAGNLWAAGTGGVRKFGSEGEPLWQLNLGGIGTAVAVDQSGNGWVVGIVESESLVGAVNRYHGEPRDGFVAMVSPEGTVNWTRYLGGSATSFGESADAVAFDDSGSALVAGVTVSTDLDGALNAYHGGASDAFVCKVSRTGDLDWSVYVGGPSDEVGRSVAVDQAGSVWVGGYALHSSALPAGQVDRASGALVARLDSSGTLLWRTTIAGSGDDRGCSIVLDGQDHAILGGVTSSPDLPAARNRYQAEWYATDGFLVGVSGSGAVEWSQYMRGIGADAIIDMTVDEGGALFVAGSTYSPDLSAATNAYHVKAGGSPGGDAFAAKLILQEKVVGTAGSDQIHISAAVVADPVTGQAMPGLQVTINGVAGEPFVPMGPVVVYGLEGHDRIIVDPGVTIPLLIYGGDGNDTILGGGGADTIYGNFGDDLILGGDVASSLMGGLGNDTLSGGAGDDTLLGGNGMDRIEGRGGDDLVYGKGKADTLAGGSGNDTLWGGAGDNVIRGGEGEDWIDAGPAGQGFVNRIDGGAGNDTVVSDGNDLLEGVETPLLP